MRFALFLLVFAGSGCVAASAGELPAGKGTSSIKPNTCANYGPGFVPVAGSDTCVRLSGHVRVEYRWGKGGTGQGRGGDIVPNAYAQPQPALGSNEAGFVFGRLKPAGQALPVKPRGQTTGLTRVLP